MELKQVVRTQDYVSQAEILFDILSIPWERATEEELRGVERTVGLMIEKLKSDPQVIADVVHLFDQSDFPRTVASLSEFEGFVFEYPASKKTLEALIYGCQFQDVYESHLRNAIWIAGNKVFIEQFIDDLKRLGSKAPHGCHQGRILFNPYVDLTRYALKDNSPVAYIFGLKKVFGKEAPLIYRIARPHLDRLSATPWNGYTEETALAIGKLAQQYPAFKAGLTDLPILIEETRFLNLVYDLSRKDHPSLNSLVYFKKTLKRIPRWPESLKHWASQDNPADLKTRTQQARLHLLRSLYPGFPDAEYHRVMGAFGDELFEVSDLLPEILFFPRLPDSVNELERLGGSRPTLQKLKPILAEMVLNPKALYTLLEDLKEMMEGDSKAYRAACEKRTSKDLCDINKGNVDWDVFIKFFRNQDKVLPFIQSLRRESGFYLTNWINLKHLVELAIISPHTLEVIRRFQVDFSMISGYVALFGLTDLIKETKKVEAVLAGELDKGIGLMHRLAATDIYSDAYPYHREDFSLLRSIGRYPSIFEPYQSMTGIKLRQRVTTRLQERPHHIRLSPDDPDYEEDIDVADDEIYSSLFIFKIDLLQCALENPDFRNALGNMLLQDYRDERGEHGGLLQMSEKTILEVSLKLDDVGKYSPLDEEGKKRADGGYNFPKKHEEELNWSGIFATHFHSVNIKNLPRQSQNLAYFTGPSGNRKAILGGDFAERGSHNVIFTLIHDEKGQIAFNCNAYLNRANLDVGSYSFEPSQENRALAEEFVGQLPTR